MPVKEISKKITVDNLKTLLYITLFPPIKSVYQNINQEVFVIRKVLYSVTVNQILYEIKK